MAVLQSAFRRELADQAAALEAALSGLSAEAALRHVLRDLFPGQACLVSSFGTESAVTLHMTAQIAPETPVLFLDTGKLFAETLAYRDRLVARLGLGDVRTLHPAAGDLSADDPAGDLHGRQPDLCCHIRKTLPLIRALAPFRLWISGRKRWHGGDRRRIGPVEIQDGKLKLNPLYDWDGARLSAYMAEHDLPAHPLRAQGYPSVGCIPCTAAAGPGESARAGRWKGSAKSECGIHISADGRAVRATS